MMFKSHAALLLIALACKTGSAVAADDLFDFLRNTQKNTPANNLSVGGIPGVTTGIDKNQVTDPKAMQQLEQLRTDYISQQTGTTTQNSIAANDARNLNAGTKDPIRSVADEAFEELLKRKFPLQPEQIKKLKQAKHQEDVAKNSHPSVPPQPISSTVHVDLSPGAHLPIIRLAPGFVSSLVFLDSTGQPWPLLDYSLGNATDFNIQWDSKTNALFVQNLKDHMNANIAVRLAGLETPIMLSFVTGQRLVDYRVDIQVPGRGPNSLAPIMDSAVSGYATNSTMLALLDNIPPIGSIELKVSDNFGRAWVFENRLFFRTKVNLLSPAWSSKVSSADGTKVYELIQTPFLIASHDGKTINIKLSGL